MDEEATKQVILKKNPSVDKALIDKALNMVQEAARLGVAPAGNRYTTPFLHTIFDRSAPQEEDDPVR